MIKYFFMQNQKCSDIIFFNILVYNLFNFGDHTEFVYGVFSVCVDFSELFFYFAGNV